MESQRAPLKTTEDSSEKTSEEGGKPGGVTMVCCDGMPAELDGLSVPLAK